MPAPKDPEKRRIWKERLRQKALDQWQRPGMREILSEAHKGQHNSPETEFKTGNKSWNEGLTKETDERLANANFHVSEEHKQILRECQLGEKNNNWVGGTYNWYHEQAWKMFGLKFCEICGMSLDEYKDVHPKNNRFSMHCRTGMWWILEEWNWVTTCEFGCHQKLDYLDRRYNNGNTPIPTNKIKFKECNSKIPAGRFG